jgi:Protein of unknown function (DUF3800)
VSRPKSQDCECIVGRTHHMLVSLWGSRWREVSLIMFTVYFDDSGTAPEHRIAVASALVIPAAQIIPLEREWNTFTQKEVFSKFHAAPMAASNRNEGYGDWDMAKQSRVFERVRQISKKYSIGPAGAVSFSINKEQYEEHVPASLRPTLGVYHYTFAIQEVLKTMAVWTKTRPVTYVFEAMRRTDPRRVELERALERYNIENFSFGNSKDIPGLQCADQIAWASFQWAYYEYFNRTPHLLAELAIHDYGAHLEKQGWLHAYTIRKPELLKFVEEEKLALSRQSDAKGLI